MQMRKTPEPNSELPVALDTGGASGIGLGAAMALGRRSLVRP